jgi:hypothetical protein
VSQWREERPCAILKHAGDDGDATNQRSEPAEEGTWLAFQAQCAAGRESVACTRTLHSPRQNQTTQRVNKAATSEIVRDTDPFILQSIKEKAMTHWWEMEAGSHDIEPPKPKAVAYYRHSAQDRQENSIPLQKEQVCEWAEKNGVEIIHEFADAGKSGLLDGW